MAQFCGAQRCATRAEFRGARFPRRAPLRDARVAHPLRRAARQAFMSGKMKIKGNMALAQKFGALVDQKKSKL